MHFEVYGAIDEVEDERNGMCAPPGDRGADDEGMTILIE